MINVAIINSSTVVTDAQVNTLTNDLQVQISDNFSPYWGVDAKLKFFPKGSTLPHDMYWLVIMDTSDVQGALGYHDLTAFGLPIGKIFAKDDLTNGYHWTVTASHELIEMLADPWLVLSTLTPGSSNTSANVVAWELCDACEADGYGYAINGSLVSDFVLPSWFDYTASPQVKYDYCGHITAPLQLLSGGYTSIIIDAVVGNGWTQVTAPEKDPNIKGQRSSFGHEGSRRDRRNTKGSWKTSTRLIA